MKKYIAVLELEDDEEIIDAKLSYFYRSNGMKYKATERMELKEESEDAKDKTYEDGLNDAWEAAKKIACISSDDGCTMEDLIKIFGLDCVSTIFKEQSANEAVTKIKEYENRIEVGDEVKYHDSIGIVIEEFNKNEVVILWSSGSTTIGIKRKDLTKTGRHFTEIEKILESMKEKE